ncbi:RNA polymerase sigma-70 factor [Parapedobacter sp. SGR-10]|uniref:RNA polymerase sigma factor n=1 Tax=Parapedobacter sp. SGR-10 TaxID=2710879 RepID=UPI0013D7290D|nr:RNA polymerase sigma-70 factor [Parapedobacter sp. SGR-10]NGF54889.1 RNA polymerase sigma-70 factor [Parapedobacter sp. SGR-10]
MTASLLPDEKELLLRLQGGDHAAFDRFYQTYSRRIFINAVKLVKNEDEAQDILQETFIRVWNSRENIDLAKPFQSYLFTVAQNLIRDFFRKAAHNRKLEAELIRTGTALYDHIESKIQDKESAILLQQAIAKLPLQRQRIFTLCKIEGKSYDEVASIMGISVSTVGNQLVKATRTVKEYLYDTESGMAILAAWFLVQL